MKIFWKIVIAVAIPLLSPSIIAFIAFGRWSRDNVDATLPSVLYLLPIFLLALVARTLFRAKKTAIGIYVVGMVAMLVLAIGWLWGELHAPAFGYIYVPTIILSVPFGLWVILNETGTKQKKA